MFVEVWFLMSKSFFISLYLFLVLDRFYLGTYLAFHLRFILLIIDVKWWIIKRGCPLRAVLPLEGFQGPKRWMCSTKLLTMIYYVKTQIFEKRIFFRTAPPPGLGRPGLKRLKRPIYLLLMNGFSKFLFSMKTIMNYEFFLTEILFFVQK